MFPLFGGTFGRWFQRNVLNSDNKIKPELLPPQSQSAWQSVQFTNATSVVINHTADIMIEIQIIDLDGNEIIGHIHHADNVGTVSFNTPQTGTIFYR